MHLYISMQYKFIDGCLLCAQLALRKIIINSSSHFSIKKQMKNCNIDSVLCDVVTEFETQFRTFLFLWKLFFRRAIFFFVLFIAVMILHVNSMSHINDIDETS